MKKEINKKILFLSIVLFSIILINLVAVIAAEDEPIAEETQTNIDRFFQALSDSISSSGFGWSIDATKATPWFLGILLWIVLYSIIIKTGIFSKNQGEIGIGAGIVSLIITIIAFLYTPADFWKAIAVQFSALGSTILVLIPFIILFYFTTAVSGSLLFSKLVWLIYIVYYFIAFIYKIAVSTASWSSKENLPYVLAIIAGIIIFSAMGIIRKMLATEEIKSEREAAERRLRKANTEAKIRAEDLDAMAGKK